MFRLDGKRTQAAAFAQLVLESASLPVEPYDSDSLALVLYRRDPLDTDLYLAAYVGLREPEPMFGPVSEARLDTHIITSPQPLGFQSRESTSLHERLRGESWELFVNTRSSDAAKRFDAVKNRIETALNEVLEADLDRTRPLYPDLWFFERLARDKLRASVRDLSPGTSIDELAKHLTLGLREIAQQWSLDSFHVGVYLDTGKDWMLCGSDHYRPWMPERVPRDTNPYNAYEWVARSGKPVLVRPPTSVPWKDRILACGPDPETVIQDANFCGLCIVPLPPQHWRCMGLIVFVARSYKSSPGSRFLNPAHLYLLTRIAAAVSNYLEPLLPIAGFPYLPEAKLGRGNAIVDTPQLENPRDSLDRMAVEAARDLMPTRARVQIRRIRDGHSGAKLFELKVVDEKGVEEVPRVLKIGPRDIIEPEVTAYYRYVHNKRVGGAARIDTAKMFHRPSRSNGEVESDNLVYGAIVYMLVGTHDIAKPWSDWAKSASRMELTVGLRLLAEQLKIWFDRRKGTGETIIDMLIEPLAHGKLKNYLDATIKTTPCIDEVHRFLNGLLDVPTAALGDKPATCIIHGDLHADNVFAILSQKNKIHDVALIDWGNVQSRRHPLSDISKLMADLAYRLNPDERMRRFAFNAVRQWGQRLGCAPYDWKFALIHQITKLMFYRTGSNGRTPYMTDNVREQAWDDVRRLAQDLPRRSRTR